MTIARTQTPQREHALFLFCNTSLEQRSSDSTFVFQLSFLLGECSDKIISMFISSVICLYTFLKIPMEFCLKSFGSKTSFAMVVYPGHLFEDFSLTSLAVTVY